MYRLVPLVLLMACQTVPPAPTALATCGGGPLSALIGQPVTSLPAAGGWGTLRVIRPGQPVSEDYSDQRLNVQLDAADRIVALSCG